VIQEAIASAEDRFGSVGVGPATVGAAAMLVGMEPSSVVMSCAEERAASAERRVNVRNFMVMMLEGCCG